MLHRLSHNLNNIKTTESTAKKIHRYTVSISLKLRMVRIIALNICIAHIYLFYFFVRIQYKLCKCSCVFNKIKSYDLIRCFIHIHSDIFICRLTLSFSPFDTVDFARACVYQFCAISSIC